MTNLQKIYHSNPNFYLLGLGKWARFLLTFKKQKMKSFIAEKLKDALVKKYEAEIADAEARLYVYFTNPVGIGEHPQHTEEMDNLVEQLANAKDKLETINNFKIYE